MKKKFTTNAFHVGRTEHVVMRSFDSRQAAHAFAFDTMLEQDKLFQAACVHKDRTIVMLFDKTTLVRQYCYVLCYPAVTK